MTWFFLPLLMAGLLSEQTALSPSILGAVAASPAIGLSSDVSLAGKPSLVPEAWLGCRLRAVEA